MSYHQTIYNLLRGYGLSEAGALGMLGNWECESGCEPYRVQGDYQASRAISKAYVDAVESGRMSREQFAGDGKGFGEAQWTLPQRKKNLWDRWRLSSCRLDSVELQVEFAIWELGQDEWCMGEALLPYLKTVEAIWDATDRICRKYECPAVNNVQARYEAALRIRSEIDLSGQSTVGQVSDNGWSTEKLISRAEVLAVMDDLPSYGMTVTDDGVTVALVDAADAAAKLSNLKPKTGASWIPVTDSLPEVEVVDWVEQDRRESGPMLGCDREGGIHIAVYCQERGKSFWRAAGEGQAGDVVIDIVAWAPLPPAP